jgi:Transposase DDE domain group 1
LSRWRKPLAFHDPAKVSTDLAVTLALGGDWMADIALLSAKPGLYGRVASDATVSRTIDAPAQRPGHRPGTRRGRKVLIRIDGHRITAFATNTKTGGPSTQLADLEIRHRRRARCEDRIRNAKDTGLRAFPRFDFTQNQIWCAIVALAVEITAWMQMLALTDHPARRWEPKRLRLRLFTVPATLARTGRRILLHLAAKAPWAELARLGITRLRALAAAG